MEDGMGRDDIASHAPSTDNNNFSNTSSTSSNPEEYVQYFLHCPPTWEDHDQMSDIQFYSSWFLQKEKKKKKKKKKKGRLENSGEMRCELCNKTFKYERNFKRHQDKHRMKRIRKRKREDDDEVIIEPSTNFSSNNFPHSSGTLPKLSQSTSFSAAPRLKPSIRMILQGKYSRPHSADFSVPNLRTSVPNLQTVIPNRQTSVPNLRTSLPNLQTSVPNLQTSVPNLQTSVPNIQTSVPKFQTSVPNLRTSVPNLQTPVLNVQTSVPNRQTPVLNVQTSVPNLQTSVPNIQTSVPNLQTSVPNLQTSVPHTQSSVPNLKTSAPNLQTSIPKLQSSIPNFRTFIPDRQTSVPKLQISVPYPQTSLPNLQTLVSNLQTEKPQINNFHNGDPTVPSRTKTRACVERTHSIPDFTVSSAKPHSTSTVVIPDSLDFQRSEKRRLVSSLCSKYAIAAFDKYDNQDIHLSPKKSSTSTVPSKFFNGHSSLSTSSTTSRDKSEAVQTQKNVQSNALRTEDIAPLNLSNLNCDPSKHPVEEPSTSIKLNANHGSVAKSNKISVENSLKIRDIFKGKFTARKTVVSSTKTKEKAMGDTPESLTRSNEAIFASSNKNVSLKEISTEVATAKRTARKTIVSGSSRKKKEEMRDAQETHVRTEVKEVAEKQGCTTKTSASITENKSIVNPETKGVHEKQSSTATAVTSTTTTSDNNKMRTGAKGVVEKKGSNTVTPTTTTVTIKSVKPLTKGMVEKQASTAVTFATTTVTKNNAKPEMKGVIEKKGCTTVNITTTSTNNNITSATSTNDNNNSISISNTNNNSNNKDGSDTTNNKNNARSAGVESRMGEASPIKVNQQFNSLKSAADGVTSQEYNEPNDSNNNGNSGSNISDKATNDYDTNNNEDRNHGNDEGTDSNNSVTNTKYVNKNQNKNNNSNNNNNNNNHIDNNVNNNNSPNSNSNNEENHHSISSMYDAIKKARKVATTEMNQKCSTTNAPALSAAVPVQNKTKVANDDIENRTCKKDEVLIKYADRGKMRPVTYPCGVCGRICKTKYHLEKHQTVHKKSLLVEKMLSTKTTIDQSLALQPPDMTEDKVAEEIITPSYGSVENETCRKDVVSIKNTDSGKMRPVTYPCGVCGRICTTKYHLEKHRTVHKKSLLVEKMLSTKTTIDQPPAVQPPDMTEDKVAEEIETSSSGSVENETGGKDVGTSKEADIAGKKLAALHKYKLALHRCKECHRVCKSQYHLEKHMTAHKKSVVAEKVLPKKTTSDLVPASYLQETCQDKVPEEIQMPNHGSVESEADGKDMGTSKQETSTMAMPVKQRTSTTITPVKQGTSSTITPVKQATSTTIEPVKQGTSTTITPVKQATSKTIMPVKQGTSTTIKPVKQATSTIITPVVHQCRECHRICKTEYTLNKHMTVHKKSEKELPIKTTLAQMPTLLLQDEIEDEVSKESQTQSHGIIKLIQVTSNLEPEPSVAKLKDHGLEIQNNINKDTGTSIASTPKEVKDGTNASPSKGVKEDTIASPFKHVKEDTIASPSKRVKEDTNASPSKRVKEDTAASPSKRVKEDTNASPSKRVKEDTVASPSKHVKIDTSCTNDVVVKFKCDECNRMFKNNYLLLKHKGTHVSKKCEQCNQEFPNKTKLSQHKCTKEESKTVKDKPHTCEMCGKVFPHRNSLFLHMKRIHTGSEVVKCTVCGREMKQTFMADHMKVHQYLAQKMKQQNNSNNSSSNNNENNNNNGNSNGNNGSSNSNSNSNKIINLNTGNVNIASDNSEISTTTHISNTKELSS